MNQLTNSQQPLEKEFHIKMVKIYKDAAKLGYRANRFLNMVYELGGVETAKKLLSTEEYIQEGIIKLWELGRLDLSVEALVLRPRYKALFTDQELKTAEKRLKELGYKNSE